MPTAVTLAQRFGAGYRRITAIFAGGTAAAANAIVQTGDDGFLDDSFIHPALVPGPIVLPAAVTIGAGKQVNIFNNNGVESVQLADATTSPPLRSDGFTIAGGASGANVKVYRRGGVNTALSGLTQDAEYFLGAAGAVTTTQNTTAGQLDQYVGKATAATTLDQLPPQLGFQN